MDITILTIIVLLGIAGEALIFHRARKRAEYEETIRIRLAHYAGRQRQ
jgi:hypothetical protein